ncbi:DUF3054 domain-containing protein [Paeniglutamicibacter terrestris]|uniref:DUF3054 domain-containing protein n=1 Tax=Paeniglutamicibacter terrestris TaxID=2723403 RepID=A0ABX1G3X9_9MICC|nr:DUF3054 domain-containing protein [Paeniglutamicibacter terrestris]NKG20946.1 DUF3054 domain-containing protein [Paeniglutamicibacter terrestris]
MTSRKTWIAYFAIDLALVVVFALSGRRSHEESLTLLGVFQTAAPFLIALTAMTLISRPWENHSRIWPTGVLVWIGTVALGLALRVLFGATAAVPFIIVAAIVLGIFLIGRRLITTFIVRRQARTTAS